MVCLSWSLQWTGGLHSLSHSLTTQAEELTLIFSTPGFVPLPKSITPSRIIENAQLYDFELSDEDINKLSTDEYVHLSWDPTVEKLEA